MSATYNMPKSGNTDCGNGHPATMNGGGDTDDGHFANTKDNAGGATGPHTPIEGEGVGDGHRTYIREVGCY